MKYIFLILMAISLQCAFAQVKKNSQLSKPSIEETKRWITEKIKAYATPINKNSKSINGTYSIRNIRSSGENLIIEHTLWAVEYGTVEAYCNCKTNTYDEQDCELVIPWNSFDKDSSILVVSGMVMERMDSILQKEKSCPNSFVLIFKSNKNAFLDNCTINRYKWETIYFEGNSVSRETEHDWEDRDSNFNLDTFGLCISLANEKDLQSRFEKAVKDLIAYNKAHKPKETY